MSTPEHPTGPDERGFGERPREAVLGESAETERERTAQQAAAHVRDGEGEGNEYAAYEQAMREHVATGMAGGPDRAIDERDRAQAPRLSATGSATGSTTAAAPRAGPTLFPVAVPRTGPTTSSPRATTPMTPPRSARLGP